MSENIREILRKAVRESSSLGSDVTFADSTQILSEGIIDSMGIFGVMTELETALGCTIPPEELVADNFQSIDTMAALVQRLMAGGTGSTEAAQ